MAHLFLALIKNGSVNLGGTLLDLWSLMPQSWYTSICACTFTQRNLVHFYLCPIWQQHILMLQKPRSTGISTPPQDFRKECPATSQLKPYLRHLHDGTSDKARTSSGHACNPDSSAPPVQTPHTRVLVFESPTISDTDASTLGTTSSSPACS